MINEQTLKQFTEAIRTEPHKTTPYDSSATVTRIENGIAYVHIPGGVDETPASMTMNAKVGDVVQVRVSGGRAWITGNATNPPTDDATAIEARAKAGSAYSEAVEAGNTAAKAYEAADLANDAAAAAQKSADHAAEAATEAWNKADSAGQAAAAAQSSADSAQQSADAAATEASNAQASANEAKQQATTATKYANNALAGLSTLESVIDTVNWFAEHKTASTDTTVDPSKTYYAYDPATGTLSAVTPEGAENPSQEGWYELDETIQNYVATHIAETDDGLYVVGLAGGWKVLVSGGEGNYAAGVFLIDPSGGIAQATTGSGITFNEGKSFYIGDEKAYIVFDGNGKINIGGAGVTVGGSKTLSQVLSQLDASLSAVEYGIGSSAADHSDIISWSSDSPAWEAGKYIWMRTTTNGLTYTYTCIQGAKGEDGSGGQRGTGCYRITTAPSTYTTKVGDYSPKFRILLSTVLSQSGADKILVGDILEYSFYHYPVGYVDETYVYTGARTSIRGATGAAGATGSAGADAVVLRIDSSRGNAFKNNAVSTTLTVTIHTGSDRITNSEQMHQRFGATAYLQWYWRRLEDDSYGVIVSTDSKLSDDGFTMTLTPDDVDTKVTFMCELITD